MKQGYAFFITGFLFLLFLISSTFIYSQQFLVNSEWKSIVGNDTSNYFYKRAKVKTDASSNVYTLGSSITATGHDILLMKQDISGDTVFIVNFNGDGNGEDFATDMWVNDYDEYVYVVGGSQSNGTDSLDPVLVVFDNTGVIISTSYSGNSSPYNDVYTSIVSDGSSYIYAGGTIRTASNGYDFLVTEYDFYGTEINESTFDYAGYDEVAVKVTLDGSGTLLLSGISEPNDSVWDYALEEYKVPGLNYNTEYRNYAGSGQTHRPTDAMYINGYYYVTGGIKTGADYDIKTVCLDTALTVIWEQTWDGPDGMDDISHSIKVDGNGNVFITGKTGLSNYSSNMVTIKYLSDGTLEWVNYYDGSDGTQNDIAFDLELNNGNVYITGYSKDGDDYTTLCYDTAGAMRWLKSTEGGFPYPSDLAIDGSGNVLMAAPLVFNLFTEKFSILEVSNEVISDTADAPICKKNEMIVKFNPSVIKTDIIDDRGKVFGKLSDFIQDSTINKMSIKLNNDLKDIYAIKIFKRFTTADSLSITRLGDTIKIEEIWSTLLITTLDTADLVEWMDSLRTIGGDIFYVEANMIGDFMDVPNDTNYSQQRNLKSSTFPNAFVKVENAWDIETGRSFIRVGVYDSGINWKHPDFSRNGSGTFSNSCAKNGYDYYLNLSNTSSILYSDTYHHGTRGAGIIGARRDNSIGVAGIAGGNGSDTSGAELYGFKLSNGIGYFISTIEVANAIMEGGYLSLNTTDNFGYAINIANHSYAFGINTFIPNPITLFTLRKAYYYSWRMGVTHSASRGNYPKSSYTENEFVIPACLHDDWIITVGANGWNGGRKVPGNGLASVPIDDNFSSMNGQPEIDCIAPGTLALVQYTTDSIAGYKGANGTSASAPHVSGVAALVFSYYNNPDNNPYSNSGFSNLGSDDMDHLIEKYSSDRETSGHDNNTGWGLLNADSIFEHIEKPRFDILHYRGDNPTSISTSLDAALVPINIDEPTNGYYGDYLANRYLVTATFNHTLPSGYSLVDYWPLKSHSVGMRSHYNPLPQFPSYIEVVSCNDTSITLKTYIYFVVEEVSTSATIMNWLVFDENQTKFPYALHIENQTAGVQEIDKFNIQVFPNPTTDIINIRANLDDFYRYEVLDMTGKIKINGSFKSVDYSIDLSTLSTSIYFLRIFSTKTSKSFKIIKN